MKKIIDLFAWIGWSWWVNQNWLNGTQMCEQQAWVRSFSKVAYTKYGRADPFQKLCRVDKQQCASRSVDDASRDIGPAAVQVFRIKCLETSKTYDKTQQKPNAPETSAQQHAIMRLNEIYSFIYIFKLCLVRCALEAWVCGLIKIQNLKIKQCSSICIFVSIFINFHYFVNRLSSQFAPNNNHHHQMAYTPPPVLLWGFTTTTERAT